MSLLKHIAELDAAVLLDGFPDIALVVLVLTVFVEVLLDGEVSFFCSLLAEDSKVFFIHVIFLS